MNVLEPAQVWVRPSVKKLGIINRTLPSPQTKPLDDLEKILTMEGLNLDKEGAESSVSSLRTELATSNRFPELVPIEDKELKTLGAGVLPTSLSNSTITKLCQSHHVDAIVSLEFFDTDTKLDIHVAQTTVSTPLGNVPAVMHNANLQTLVKTGWRFYDPQSSMVVDEFYLDRTLSAHSQGVNPMEAVKALAHRKDAVKQAGGDLGTVYADRVLPYWIRVKRDYYLKGNNALKTAARKAQSGNWDGAAEIWKRESSNSDPKIAGRAAYNYAIIHEINGDLDEAIKWAQKAYEDYNEKLALPYIRILKGRKERVKRLDS